MQFPDPGPALQGIPWAVVGAAATRLYMPERLTRDLDILVRFADRDQVHDRLQRAGWTVQGELAVPGTHWSTPFGEGIDVLELSEPWVEEALKAAQNNRDAQGFPVLTLSYLSLMKIAAGRVQDLADVTRMLGQAADNQLDAVRALIRTYMPEALPDVESMITLGRLELADSDGRP